MFDFLNKFVKRMEWLGVANSIINRKGKNVEIESLFKDNEMTNIIISTLLFIMEKTLEENNECEMYHIERFLEELIHNYYISNIDKEKIRDISNYIIKDILQNNGQRLTYTTKNYDKNSNIEIGIRLISDKIVDDGNSRKIVYMLTNQGYDFLFRTREVDEEIKLTIEQLKLREYIKRKKFNSAVRQSIELINLVRQKKKEIENFILSIRQNIHTVDVEIYEELINSTYSILTEEYEIMNEINEMVAQAENKIKEEFENSREIDEKIIQARKDLFDIHHNIGVVITEQRDLITSRYNLTELYMDTIEKSLEFSFIKRYDFEETILKPLEEYSFCLDNLYHIIRPLFLSRKIKHLSVPSIYEEQIIFRETESPDPLLIDIEEYDDTKEKKRIEEINQAYIDVVRLIIENSMTYKEITLSTILGNLKTNNKELYNNVIRNKYIFRIPLKLYDIGNIQIKNFYKSGEKVIMTPTEEFNLEYCLVSLEGMEDIANIEELQVEKLSSEIEETYIFEEDGLSLKETIKMSDILFRAVMSWTI